MTRLDTPPEEEEEETQPEAPPQEGTPEMPEEMEPSTPPDGNPPGAWEVLYPVFLDAANRCVRKQTAAVERASERYDGNLPAFLSWATDFFSISIDFISATFTAPAFAYWSMTRTAGRPLLAICQVHADQAKEEAIAAYDARAIKAYLAGEKNRSEILAKAIMTEISKNGK